MFGQLKENIYLSFDKAKNNPDELKVKVFGYFKALKESNSLREMHDLYTLVETASFDSEVIANGFIDECVTKLRDISKDSEVEIGKLHTLVSEGIEAKISDKIKALDRLVFENLNLKDKYDQKTLLIKQLTQSQDKKVDYKEMISNLDKKVNTQVSKLTTEQKQALEIFMENDESKMKGYYTSLIESAIETLEEKILATESVEVNRTLIASKKKLQQYKSQTPNIAIVDSIIELKQDLSA